MRVVDELHAVDLILSHQFEEEIGAALSENGDLHRQDVVFGTDSCRYVTKRSDYFALAQTRMVLPAVWVIRLRCLPNWAKMNRPLRA
jgi:hypothetical protein